MQVYTVDWDQPILIVVEEEKNAIESQKLFLLVNFVWFSIGKNLTLFFNFGLIAFFPLEIKMIANGKVVVFSGMGSRVYFGFIE